MGKVSHGIKTMSYITIPLEIENWESTAFQLMCTLLEDSKCIAAEVIKKRIFILEEKITDAKKGVNICDYVMVFFVSCLHFYNCYILVVVDHIGLGL